jgi:hypothetical protein
MNTIHLEPSQVPAHLRGEYSGKKFQARVCETVSIPADAGLWSGGSRNEFFAVDIVTGEGVPFPGQDSHPFDRGNEARSVALVPGIAVVEHSTSCGQDMGLRFYVHPSNAATLLPAPSAELTATERLVLIATRSFKASYGGRDRYDMARDEMAWRADAPPFPSRGDWDSAKALLTSKGLLNKAGAITVAGRNAIGSERI